MPTRVTSSMLAASLQADLRAAAERVSVNQRKIGSGREISRPSDNPFATSRVLAARSELDAVRQRSDNVSDALAWQRVTETAMSAIHDTAQRARELLVQGASDTVGPGGREAIASEIDGLIDDLKTQANVSLGGRYVFSGTATGTRPYALGASDAYAGDAGSVAREIGPGIAVPISVHGRSVLGDGGADGRLLSTLRRISTDLRAGNTAALSGTNLATLDTNLDQIATARATTGATTTRLESAADRLMQLEETALAILSPLQDVDYGKAALELNVATATYQAALRAGASIVQPTLMDFLSL